MAFYKLELDGIKKELEKGRLTAKGAVFFAVKILGFYRPVRIETVQNYLKLPKATLYRAIATLEQEGEIEVTAGTICLKTEVPEVEREAPKTGLEVPKTGLEVPKMGLELLKTQSEREDPGAVDKYRSTSRSNRSAKDDDEGKPQNGKEKKSQDTHEKIRTITNTAKDTNTAKEGQNSAAAAASDREESEASDPPAHPAAATDDETLLINWIITNKLPLLPQKPVIPRAVARSLARHAEIMREFKDWKEEKRAAAATTPKT